MVKTKSTLINKAFSHLSIWSLLKGYKQQCKTKIKYLKLVPKPISTVPIRVTGIEEALNKYLMKGEKGSSNIILIIQKLLYKHLKNTVCPMFTERGDQMLSRRGAMGRLAGAEQLS